MSRDVVKNSKSINGLKHIPEKWSKPTICKSTNCYAYALNLNENPITKMIFKNWNYIQPGNICNRQGNKIYWSSVLRRHNKTGINKFVKSIREDCRFLGYEIRKSSLKEVRKGNWWKVVLYFEEGDYHWYRQNDDGTWSHKIGEYKVKNVDESEKIITNPETCDRGGYNKFISYFLIRKKVI